MYHSIVRSAACLIDKKGFQPNFLNALLEFKLKFFDSKTLNFLNDKFFIVSFNYILIWFDLFFKNFNKIIL